MQGLGKIAPERIEFRSGGELLEKPSTLILERRRKHEHYLELVILHSTADPSSFVCSSSPSDSQRAMTADLN